LLIYKRLKNKYYSPRGFTNVFRFGGQSLNVREQQDAHEFFNLLCDYLENLMKGTDHEKLLPEVCGGSI
jgi:ubiquitin C-terminal hydrolase